MSDEILKHERRGKPGMMSGAVYNHGWERGREQGRREAADEIERLQEIFRRDGEQHAAHIRALEEQHQARLTAYAAEIERLVWALGEIAQETAAVDAYCAADKFQRIARRALEGK